MSRVAKGLHWIDREGCPLCGSHSSVEKGTVHACQSRASFGDFEIEVPSDVIIKKCQTCGILYKSRIVLNDEIVESIGDDINGVWQDNSDYSWEISAIRKLVPNADAKIMDIGAANGHLLRELSPFYRNLSANDIWHSKRCEDAVSNRYVVCPIDKLPLILGGETFDLLTMFDVVEHLPDLRASCRALKSLVCPGGYILLETGAGDSSYPRRFGPHRWWYLNLPEHNQAFTMEAIHYMAQALDAEVVSIRIKRHKTKRCMTTKALILETVKSLGYQLSPEFFLKFAPMLGKRAVQPADPLVHDHVSAVFRLR